MIYIIAIVASLSFGSGYYASTIACKAEQAQRIEAINKKLIDAAETNARLTAKLERLNQHNSSNTKATIKYVTKYITKEQKDSSSVCAIDANIVRLLNSLRLSKAISGTDETSATFAADDPYTEEDLINYAIVIISKYNDARNQCNSLIEFLSDRR
jgi:uncharacterized coiled-coil protein SlyX